MPVLNARSSSQGGRRLSRRTSKQTEAHEIKEYPDTKVVVVVSDKCKKALDSLLRQTQVMMDWRADPVLENGKWQQNTKIFFT